MPDTGVPHSIAPTPAHVLPTGNPARRLLFPLHRSSRPRPSIEQLEDNRLVARQTERSQRGNEGNYDNSSNNDSDSDSIDSITDCFASRATRFPRSNYVSPAPSSTRPVSTLIEQANADMQQGKIDVSRDFICPILQMIPLDPVRMNSVLFERSAVERYIEDALTDDIVNDGNRGERRDDKGDII